MKAYALNLFLGALVVNATPLSIHIDIEGLEGLNGVAVQEGLPSNTIDDVTGIDLYIPADDSSDGFTINLNQQPISIQEKWGIPGGSIICDERIKALNIERAIDAALLLVQRGKTIGVREYPHQFRNDEKIPFPECKEGAAAKYEFPITKGSVYKGEEPGMNRAIFLVKSKTKAVYCCSVIHLDDRSNRFKPCRKGE